MNGPNKAAAERRALEVHAEEVAEKAAENINARVAAKKMAEERRKAIEAFDAEFGKDFGALK